MPTIPTIPFASPSIDKEELLAVERVLTSGWLTSGKEVREFEKEFLESLNVPSLKALAVQSCTAGLHLAYLVLNKERLHTVLSTPLTFISSVSAALQCGMTIQFVDVAPRSMYPDIDTLEHAYSTSKSYILTLVPLAGHHTQYTQLFDFAAHNDIKTIEDAAHAWSGCIEIHDTIQPIGTIADIGVYSFYANKNITTGEGGMVVCKDDTYYTEINTLRNLGMTTSTWERLVQDTLSFKYDVIDMGYKYNMPDVLACIGRTQLQKSVQFHAKRVEIAQYYINRLVDRDYLVLPEFPHEIRHHAWHLFIIQVRHPRITRDEFMNRLLKKGIGTSVHYRPLHVMKYFQEKHQLRPEDFPNSVDMYEHILSLPIYPTLAIEHVEYVCNTILDIGDNN